MKFLSVSSPVLEVVARLAYVLWKEYGKSSEHVILFVITELRHITVYRLHVVLFNCAPLYSRYQCSHSVNKIKIVLWTRTRTKTMLGTALETKPIRFSTLPQKAMKVDVLLTLVLHVARLLGGRKPAVLYSSAAKSLSTARVQGSLRLV